MDIVSTFKSLPITRFLEEIGRGNFIWAVKRLSGNDTGLTGSHQVGLYLPRDFFKRAFPGICTTEKYNPDILLNECYVSNADILIKGLRAVYYNSKYFPERGLKKKYDEFRLTRWGGKSNPLQNAESTGSICVFAVLRTETGCSAVAWVASSIGEEDIIEDWIGEEVEPGRFVTRPAEATAPRDSSEIEIPDAWLTDFPSGHEIFQFVVELTPRSKWRGSVDGLLLKRREIEFNVFKRIEEQDVLPKIQKGFVSAEEFIKYSHTVSNRRKSRAGTSLELNLESIFRDERIAFETQRITENRKKPDFLFPSGLAYHDSSFPEVRLQMLASKTCCKDRWRQVLNEANRIKTKHLFTLQQGVSSQQLQEMKDNNVRLVIPSPCLRSFPKVWRNTLLTLEEFVSHVRTQQASVYGLERWIT